VSDDGRIAYTLDFGLSDRELLLLGKIILQWGAMEHEIFSQTLLTFADFQGEQTSLPKAMDNLQVTELLNLWKQRVVDQSEGARGRVLQQQFEEILNLKKFRDALVHGKWEWSATDLSRISTTRVRKNEVITTHFSADDLDNINARLESINSRLRLPGGLEDLARLRAAQGHAISRRALGLLTGHPIAQGWLSKGPEPDNRESE
jgi:hypothetical protein